MEKQSHDEELKNGRLVRLERKPYLYRKVPELSVLGHRTATYVTIDKIENRGHGIDGDHSVGAAVRQISLDCHLALVQIGRAVHPVVVHRGQNVREYPATDR